MSRAVHARLDRLERRVAEIGASALPNGPDARLARGEITRSEWRWLKLFDMGEISEPEYRELLEAAEQARRDTEAAGKKYARPWYANSHYFSLEEHYMRRVDPDYAAELREERCLLRHLLAVEGRRRKEEGDTGGYLILADAGERGRFVRHGGSPITDQGEADARLREIDEIYSRPGPYGPEKSAAVSDVLTREIGGK